MFRQLIMTFTLAVVIMALSSCTKMVKIPAVEQYYISENDGKEKQYTNIEKYDIVSIEMAYDIIGVALGYDQIIGFDSLGGSFDYETQTISGTDISGNEVSYHLKEIKQVIHSDNAAFLKFDHNKGRINKSANLITGTTDDGRYVKQPLDEVLFIRFKKTDVLATSIVIGVPLLITVLGYALDDTQYVDLSGLEF